MRAADLNNKRVVIWGLGKEGKGIAWFIRKAVPDLPLVLADEAEGPAKIDGLPENCKIVRGIASIEAALNQADVLIKSPGVSLYHPLIRKAEDKGVTITSLLNLWFAGHHSAKTICVTGTKGKSTTSSLLAHVLKALGQKTVLGGNIGIPVAEISGDGDFAVIEVSSYQAADFDSACDIAILTSLHPEHLDWHGSDTQYFIDKLNLLTRAKVKIVNRETLDIVQRHGISSEGLLVFNDNDGFHVKDGKIFDGGKMLGVPDDSFLTRAHNLSNICAVLTAIKYCGLDPVEALKAMHDYRGLPHRQQELGEKDGILYVNDSIATAPHAAIAALEVYHARPVTLIAGGFDRGVNYQPLIDYIVANKIHTVICLGPSGQRIHDGLKKQRSDKIFIAAGMKEAVARAKNETAKGGVVLLSPAAPSFGLFRDYAERGKCFTVESGFSFTDGNAA